MGKQRFDYPSPGDSPGLLLWRLTSAWQRSLHEVLRPFDLTHPQFVLLASSAWIEAQGDTANQAAIGDLSGTDANTVSATIRRLEEKGLVIRRPGDHDRRTRVVSLTVAGHAVLESAVPAVESADADFFADTDNAKQITALSRQVG